jgi:hypothetical protein
MMDMTPLRRTVLVMLLVAIPWSMVGVFSIAFLMQTHLEEGMTYSFGMRVFIVVGGVLCIFALALFVDGIRKKQINPLLIIFALSGLWYLIEWPVKALLAILRS